MTSVDRASTILARAVVWAIWVPVDRTVCRFAELTHHP